MNLSSLITDNITELLVKIIEFTEIRQKILTRNINNMNTPGFVPKDLEVNELCQSLLCAISEHARNQRLVLCDTENIKFGPGGSFQVSSVIDQYAKELFRDDSDEYLALQINKLLENSLNQRIAAELLRKKQDLIPFPD